MRPFLGRLLVVVSAAVLVCGSYFANPPAAKAAEANPINVGVCMDFSGPTAQDGLQEFPAFEMAVKEKNAAGGINGRPIKLSILDNSGDPTKTTGALKVLKDINKVSVVYYGINSVGALAAKTWAEQNSIAVIATTPMSDRLIQEQGKAWFFRTQFTNTEAARGFLMQAKKMGFKKIGLQITTQAFGTDLETVLKKHLDEFGLDLVGVARCEPDSKDLTIQATRLRATNPDVVIHQDYPAEQAVFARALKTIGWNVPCIAQAVIINMTLTLAPPELFEGWTVFSIYDRDKPGVKALWDKYETYTKKRNENDLSLRGWDTAQILFEILRLSDNPDNPEAIRDAFYKVKNFPMVTGRRGAVCNFEIGRNYVLSAKDFVWNTVKAGKVVPIATK